MEQAALLFFYAGGLQAYDFNLGGTLNITQNSSKNLSFQVGGNLFNNSFFNQNLSFQDITFLSNTDNSPISLGGSLTGRNIYLAALGSGSTITLTNNISASGNLTLQSNNSTIIANNGITLTADSGVSNSGSFTLIGGLITNNANLTINAAEFALTSTCDGNINTGTGTLTLVPTTAKAITIGGSIDQKRLANRF